MNTIKTHFRPQTLPYTAVCARCESHIGKNEPHWIAETMEFDNQKYMVLKVHIRCQKCRSEDTVGVYREHGTAPHIEPDPDGAHITEIWGKRLERNNSGGSRGGGSEELLPRAESVRSTPTGSLSRVRTRL